MFGVLLLNLIAMVLHSYSPSMSHTDKPFGLLHSDVWGPASEFNSHGFYILSCLWMIVFV